MKREIIIAIFTATSFSSCATLQKPSEKINIIDSLKIKEELGEIVERTYEGIANDTTYTLTIYSQKYSGDGVFGLLKEKANTHTSIYGRRYTLRGDATNINATVYQLTPYDKLLSPIFFLYKDSCIQQLNKNLESLNLQLHLKNQPL